MSKVLSFRVPDEDAEWADAYAAERGVSRQDLLAGALASFKEDARAGVPEIRELVKRQRAAREQRETGPKPSRDDFARSCGERSELFGKLRAPESTRRWGSEKK